MRGPTLVSELVWCVRRTILAASYCCCCCCGGGLDNTTAHRQSWPDQMRHRRCSLLLPTVDGPAHLLARAHGQSRWGKNVAQNHSEKKDKAKGRHGKASSDVHIRCVGCVCDFVDDDGCKHTQEREPNVLGWRLVHRRGARVPIRTTPTAMTSHGRARGPSSMCTGAPTFLRGY